MSTELIAALRREAARIAGLDVLRMVNEPTAAAMAYGLVNSVRGWRECILM